MNQMNAQPSVRLSLTDLVVLALVDEEPRHGFAVVKELKKDGDIGRIWAVPGPLVYRSIEHLQLLGLIEATGTEPGERGPTRRVLCATATGHERVRDWLTRPVEHARDVRSELLVKLVLAQRRRWSIDALVRKQLERFRPMAISLRQKVAVTEGPNQLVASWRSENMAAIVRMLEALAAERSIPRSAGH